MFCPHCGKSNEDGATVCQGCGKALPQSGPDANAFPPEARIEEGPEEFFKAVIGPSNQAYYLRHFSRFDSQGKAGPSWHWPAFFVTFYWFLYRKMWLGALLYFVLPYLVMFTLGIIGGVVGGAVGGAIMGIGYLLLVASIFVVPAMYANAWYYKLCKTKIAQARVSSKDTQRQLGELTGKGGTSGVVVVFVCIFVFIGMIGMLAAIAIPAYADYTTRARMTEAAVVGKIAADSVADYYREHQQTPGSLKEAGFEAPLPRHAKDISLNSQTAVVTITMAVPPVDGKSIMLVPAFDANRNIVWTCMSQDIQDKYLPRHCRK